MIKKIIKAALGEKNIARVHRLRQSIDAARAMWSNSSGTVQSRPNQTALVCLMHVHQLEKALAVERTDYLDKVNYTQLIDKLSGLISGGMSPQDFTIKECSAVIKAVLSKLSGHDEEKAQLASFIKENNIALDFRGGVERVSSSELLSHTDFDFGAFVRSRHSVRRFKDKIISRDVIRDIVRDALYCPSACNRQPFRVYFSENPATVRRIIEAHSDKFFSLQNVHDCLIVTCDRALFSPSELNDQEYINGGIFLGYLVLSIHAHGLGSCLFQFLQADRRQAKIRREFGISESEVISAFVGIGELEDEVNCACTQRRSVDEVAICLK